MYLCVSNCEQCAKAANACLLYVCMWHMVSMETDIRGRDMCGFAARHPYQGSQHEDPANLGMLLCERETMVYNMFGLLWIKHDTNHYYTLLYLWVPLSISRMCACLCVCNRDRGYQRQRAL